MKRCLALLLLLATMLLLSGCIIIPVEQFYDDIETERVVSVEIYDLREHSVRSKLPEGEEPAYTLPEAQIDDFCTDLSQVEFTEHIIIVLAAIDPSFSFGDWVVRVNYDDGGYMLISNGGYNITMDADRLKSSRNHWDADSTQWQELIQKYLPEDLQ